MVDTLDGWGAAGWFHRRREGAATVKADLIIQRLLSEPLAPLHDRHP
jgi:hypothetical protein